jgi:hypothetical protein
VKNVLSIALAAAFFAAAPVAHAGDFDGSRPLLCAPVEVADCVPDTDDTCVTSTPGQLGAPTFLRIDFAKQTVTGPHGVTKIATVEKHPVQLLLQGIENGHAFSIAVDRTGGGMTATLGDMMGAFVLFGACTPL